MTHHDHEPEHHEHQHHGHPTHKRRAFHKDWRAWLVVGLMLAAMAAYILAPGQRMPAAPGPPAEAPGAP